MITLEFIAAGRSYLSFQIPTHIMADRDGADRIARVLVYAVPIIAREEGYPVTVLAHCPNGVTRIMINMKGGR